jgi:Rieske Fe-S protein
MMLHGMSSAPDCPSHACVLPPGASARCSRRDAVAALGSLVVLAACGDRNDDVVAPGDDGIHLGDGVVVLDLARVVALQRVPSALVLGAQQLIVLRLATSEYRAFSNVCTHSGCGIFLFERDRMICQCHGSEFATDGRNVAGPAPAPLQRFQVTLEDAERRIRIDLRQTVQ